MGWLSLTRYATRWQTVAEHFIHLPHSFISMFYQTEIETLYRISASTNRFGWWGQMSECDGWMELGGGPCGRVVNIVFINLIGQKPITTLTYVTYVIFSLTELDIYLHFLSPVRTWDPLHPKNWQFGSSLALALRGGAWGAGGSKEMTMSDVRLVTQTQGLESPKTLEREQTQRGQTKQSAVHPCLSEPY